MQQNNGFLVLESGMVFTGRLFGSSSPSPEELKTVSTAGKSAGEVVFNTGMTGYHEILTDPSYTGQIVVMTYPHIGNYGCDPDWSEAGTEKPEGTEKIKAAGLVVRSLYTGKVPGSRITLDTFLNDTMTPGISDVDTRSLTLHIRDQGSLRGIIVRSAGAGADLTPGEAALCGDYLSAFPVMEGRDLVVGVGTDKPFRLNESGKGPHIALYDCGIKAGIIRECTNLDCVLTVFPSHASAEDVLKVRPDAVLVSNGPGDPAVLHGLVREIRKLLGKLPVFGICLGHQVISLALSAKTFKMKFGHHGVNHPVRDELTGKVYITSQNHGFAVQEGSLPDDAGVWFTNCNDGTIEGLYHKRMPVKSVQFHPESAPGPEDTTWIFSSLFESLKS